MPPHIDTYRPKWSDHPNGTQERVAGWRRSMRYDVTEQALNILGDYSESDDCLPTYDHDEALYITDVHEDDYCRDHRPGIFQALGIVRVKNVSES